jgi:RNA polymerase sigma-70 factor (ECF subfamily)
METGDHILSREAQAFAFQQGEETALAFFYREFQPALALYAFRWVSRPIAEEIASDALVKTWKMHGKLDSYPSIRAYLYKTVRRDCLHASKREQKRDETHQKSRPPEITSDTPFDHTVRSEVYRLIHTALRDLSPGNQKVLRMHYLEGKSTGEIAKELHLSPNTINTQKVRGLEALRKRLLKPVVILLCVILQNFFQPL